MMLERNVEDYCPLARELIEAAGILESDSQWLTSAKVDKSLAEWLYHKADVLDQHYRIWLEEEERYPNSEVNNLGGAQALAEDHYSHALAVAREVIILHEQLHGRKLSFKDKVRKIFGRSGLRKS